MPCDSRIIEKSQAGDQAARDAVVMDMLPLVQHIARRLNGGRRAMDDQVQEGILAVLECLPRYDAHNSAGATFATFAGYFILRALLKQRDGDMAFSTDRENIPLDTLPARTDLPQMHDLPLDCLSEQQGIVVSRTFGLGCAEQSTEEIADNLGVTPRRVKQILQAALDRLRVMIPEQEDC